MIKRNVRYTITNDDAVMPNIPQYGGVKGEHNATVVMISLDEGVYTPGDIARLSFTTGDGSVISSDILTTELNGTYIEYMIPQLLTVAAGQLCMRVVLSRMDDEGCEVCTYRSPEMVLYFDEASVENGTPFWTGVSEMLKRTASAKDAAVTAAADAGDKAAIATRIASNVEILKDQAETASEEAENRAQEALSSAKSAEREATRAENAANEAEYHEQLASDKAIEAERFAASAAEQAALSAPYIGDNGNWFVLGVDTGVKAQSERGASGIHVGADEPPEDCVIRFNPKGIPSVYKPVAKTADMTNPVGVDEKGQLWASPTDCVTSRVEKSESDTVCELEPNVFYVFPKMETLDIALGGEIDTSIVQEYKFRFTSGETATTLILPDSVRGDISVEANSVIEISIVDNYAVCQSWVVG